MVAARSRRPGRGRRRHRAGTALAAGLGALVVAAVVAALVPVPYEAITPGTGIPVSTLVTVPPAHRHSHKGAVVLTDVELVPLRALTWLYYKLQSGDQVVPTSELTGSATATQYDEQGVIDMANARQAATVVALRTLGYGVRAVADGVIVYDTVPGSPAARALKVGQVVTALDGTPTVDLAALARAIDARSPGTVVTLAVHPFGGGRSGKVRVRLGQLRVQRSGGQLLLACLPAGARPAGAKPPAGTPTTCLGITAPTAQSEQSYRVTGLPFPVHLSSDGIVGPSAGLSFTLGLLQVLASRDLTGGRRVAATGTMSVTGQVGQVGGVAQKTTAVEAAGATVFLVPAAEAATARARANGHLKVLGVTSIAQAIGDLRRLGGRLGRLPGRSRS
ncbi:MAG: PDZ domain-containing protein [Actinomycetota bacterium]|nr:PDZ domain-containing protein [Actinomycetota bacterium]